MKPRPRFSIIIPVYNLEKFISRCIDSILMQTFNSWEIIVINDGSYDNSLNVIKAYAHDDHRILLIDKTNEGLSAARNDAIKICSGEYVIFVDGDDWLETNSLEVINNLIGRSKVDLVVYQVLYYYADENIVIRNSLISEGIYTGIDFLNRVLLNKQYNFFIAPAKAYKRSFLIDNELGFIHGILHEDTPFFFQVCHKAETIILSNKPLYYYRQRRDNQITSSRTYKHYQGYIAGISNILDLYGLKNKIINGALLSFYIILAREYKIKKDRNRAFIELRKISTKFSLINLLIHSTIDFKIKILGFFLVLDPLLLNWIYKIKFFFFGKKEV